MFRSAYTLSLLLVLLASACTSPGMGYRSPSTDPDVQLAGLLGLHRGDDIDLLCENACAETGQPDCAQCRHLMNDRGRIIEDPERTQVAVERMLIEFPNHAPTLFAAATLAYQSGEKEAAAGFLDELLTRHARHPEAGILRSRIAIAEGNLPGARRAIERQILLTPDHAGLREAHSATYFLEGELLQSLEELEVAERLGAPAWRVAYNRGLIAEAAGNPRGAIEQYEISLAERPDYPAAISRRGGLLATAGEGAF